MKSVHPRLAVGTITLLILFLIGLVEIITGIPLFRKYYIFVLIIVAIPIVVLYSKFDKKYDPEDNDDAKAIVFLIVTFIVFIIIAISLSTN